MTAMIPVIDPKTSVSSRIDLRNADCLMNIMMRDHREQLGTNDLGLLVFVIVAGWMIIFQSGLI